MNRMRATFVIVGVVEVQLAGNLSSGGKLTADPASISNASISISAEQ